MLFRSWICQSVHLLSLDCLTVKAVKPSTNVSYKNCALLWYAKKEKYLQEICLLLQKNIFQAYLNLAPKLDVPKIGIPQPKWT